jgi:predicted enzyme related to lactoylglutathione lyase
MHHFSFTKLVVGDLAASESFYVNVFGLTATSRVTSEIATRGIDEIIFAPTAPGAGAFILLSYQDTDVPGTGEVIVGFVVADADDVLARVEAAGGTIVRPAKDMPEHRARVAFAADPEGHLLEIVQVIAAA